MGKLLIDPIQIGNPVSSFITIFDDGELPAIEITDIDQYEFEPENTKKLKFQINDIKECEEIIRALSLLHNKWCDLVNDSFKEISKTTFDPIEIIMTRQEIDLLEQEFLVSDDYEKSFLKARHDLGVAVKDLGAAIGQTGLGKLFKKLINKMVQR